MVKYFAETEFKEKQEAGPAKHHSHYSHEFPDKKEIKNQPKTPFEVLKTTRLVKSFDSV